MRCPDHRTAVDAVLTGLAGVLGAGWGTSVAAAGHRVVHGGPSLCEPTVVDEAVVAELVRQTELAPLHNGRAWRCCTPPAPYCRPCRT